MFVHTWLLNRSEKTNASKVDKKVKVLGTEISVSFYLIVQSHIYVFCRVF